MSITWINGPVLLITSTQNHAMFKWPASPRCKVNGMLAHINWHVFWAEVWCRVRGSQCHLLLGGTARHFAILLTLLNTLILHSITKYCLRNRAIIWKSDIYSSDPDIPCRKTTFGQQEISDTNWRRKRIMNTRKAEIIIKMKIKAVEGKWGWYWPWSHFYWICWPNKCKDNNGERIQEFI